MQRFIRFFTQTSVWVLILPALLVLAFTDLPLVLTLVQWSAFALVLAGLSIVVSMVIFPQVDLTYLVRRASDGDMAAAIVAGALLVFFGLLFYSMVFWAKA
jgi:hypothetical protein